MLYHMPSPSSQDGKEYICGVRTHNEHSKGDLYSGARTVDNLPYTPWSYKHIESGI
jgi:hypothetical protein